MVRRIGRDAMSATLDHDRPALELSVGRRMLVLLTVLVSSVAYNAATFTATAILPQMQGAMSATQDEISWTVTFNILATAVFTPMTGWLVTRFGRGNVQFYSLAFFTVATLMCGLAQSLEALVFWRIVQGAAGRAAAAARQDDHARRLPAPPAWPRHLHLRHDQYGRPGAGSRLRRLSRRALQLALGLLHDRAGGAGGDDRRALRLAARATPASRWRSTGPASCRCRWPSPRRSSCYRAASGSTGSRVAEIVIATIIAVLALYIFIAHSLTAEKAGKTPFLSPRLLLDRNYAIGTFLIVIFGMLNFAPMVLMPPLLQNQLGYPDSLIGFVVGWRGMGVMSGFGAAIFTGKLDARVGMVLGFGLQIVSGLWLTSIDFNASLCRLLRQRLPAGPRRRADLDADRDHRPSGRSIPSCAPRASPSSI